MKYKIIQFEKKVSSSLVTQILFKTEIDKKSKFQMGALHLKLKYPSQRNYPKNGSALLGIFD